MLLLCTVDKIIQFGFYPRQLIPQGMQLGEKTSSTKDKQTKAQTKSDQKDVVDASQSIDEQSSHSTEKQTIIEEQGQVPKNDSSKKYNCKSGYFSFSSSLKRQSNYPNSQNYRFQFAKDKPSIREMDIKIRNFSRNRHQFTRSYVSQDKSVVEVVVYISQYQVRIRIKNMFEDGPDLQNKQFSQGGFGKCFRVYADSEKKNQDCLKQILFHKPELYIYDELDKAIKQVAIYKLASELKIAPQFKTISLVSNQKKNPLSQDTKQSQQAQQPQEQGKTEEQNNRFDLVVYSSCAIFLTQLCIPLPDYLEFHDQQQTSATTVSKIYSDASECLEKLHALFIVHRDIKPQNIVFNQSLGKFVLCDFGLTHTVNSNETSIKYFEGTLKYSLPEMQKAHKSKKQTLIDLFENDKHALKLTILECSKFSKFLCKKSRVPEPISLRIINQIYDVENKDKNDEIRFEFMKRIYGFNKEISALWKSLILIKKPLFEAKMKQNTLLSSQTKRQFTIFDHSFLKKYQSVYQSMLLEKNDVEEIVAFQQSQGYINFALENLDSCLNALKAKDPENYKKQLNFLVAMINIRKEYYFSLDSSLMEEFISVVSKYQGEDKIIYQLMIKIYRNKNINIKQIQQDLKAVEKLSQKFSFSLLKLIEKLLFFVIDFGYDNKISRLQIMIFQLILKIRRRNKIVFDYQLGEIYARLGKTYSDFQCMEVSEAIVVEILDGSDKQSQVLIGEVYQSKSYYYHKTRQYIKCENESRKAMEIYKRNFNTHSLSYAMTLNNYSHFWQNKGASFFDKVIKYRKESLKLREENVGIETLRYCIGLFDLISVHEYEKNQQKLKECYTQLKKILESLRDVIEEKPGQNVGRLIQFYFKAACKIDQYIDWNFVNPGRFFSIAAYYVMCRKYDKSEILNNRKQPSKGVFASMTQQQRLTRLFQCSLLHPNTQEFERFYQILFYLCYQNNEYGDIMQKIIQMFPKSVEGWMKHINNNKEKKLPYYLDQLI